MTYCIASAVPVPLHLRNQHSGSLTVEPRPLAGAAIVAPTAVADLQPEGESHYTPEADSLMRYKKVAKQREGLADEARAEAGGTEFEIGQSLRMTWMAAQRLDKELMGYLANKQDSKGYRFGPDGYLKDK